MASTSTQTSRHLIDILAPYREPQLRRALSQLANSAIPFALLWAAMLYSIDYGYWITLLLAIPASGFLLRLFMIQHDCGHGSFFKLRMANDMVGGAIGVLTLVPYRYWLKTHAIHHKTSGDLDHRSFGDIDTLTVNEYLALSKLKRLRYRLYRNPFILLILGPAYQLILKHRFPADIPRSWKREWASVHKTNLALLAILILAWQTIGVQRLLMVHLPISLLSGSIGIWLFYIQHQFEDTYWRHHKEWDFIDAGIRGSSHYDLPKILQWFTANIGLHHIHHLSSRIPNYRLQKCCDENEQLRRVTRVTLGQSFKCLLLSLWDEEQGGLVGFRHLKTLGA